MIINKRDLLKGLIAVPAIVSINNIMPVRAIERFTSVPTYDNWCLVKDFNNSLAWMKKSDVDTFLMPLNVLTERKMNYPIGEKERTQFTVDLMKIKNAQVVHEVPYSMKKSNMLINPSEELSFTYNYYERIRSGTPT